VNSYGGFNQYPDRPISSSKAEELLGLLLREPLINVGSFRCDTGSVLILLREHCISG
jgi:hypothetical protein